MLPLISVVFVILAALGLKRLVPVVRKHRRQVRFIRGTLANSRKLEGAFYMDGIWISGCLNRRDVKRYVVPASAMMRSALRQHRTLSLHDVYNGRQYNNNETIAFFGDIWDVFASH